VISIKFLSSDFDKNIDFLDSHLRIDASFDIVGRNILIGDKKAKLYFIDGFIKDDIMERIMQFLMSADCKSVKKLASTRDFANKYIPYVETEVSADINTICTFVLSGALALLIEGFEEAVIIDARTYPVRSLGEPEDEKVLRGAHDGFAETLIFNTALIRRRIRDVNLTMEIFQVGAKSKTDVTMCYLDNKADKKLVDKIRKKIKSIDISSLSMGQESLAECLTQKQYFNPFPKVRYTERPDAAAACINEGKIIIITDTSPSVMILPSGVIDFIQDTNDFYFPPIVGTYLRFIRMFVFGLNIFLTPVWYLFIKNPEFIPTWLDFIRIESPIAVPVIAQLLIAEIVIDALKLASLNTPSSLSSSFSVIGALVLGEFAVGAKWLVPEVVLYMAYVAITNFAQPSYELGYAFKLFRMLILVLTAIFNIYGFIAGFALMILMICLTKTISGKGYLYPLVPFNGKALLSLFVRRKISKDNS